MEPKKIYHILDRSFDSKTDAELGFDEKTFIYDRTSDVMYRYSSPKNKNVSFGEWKVKLIKYLFGKNKTASRRMSSFVDKYELFKDDVATSEVTATKTIPATNIVWQKKINDTEYNQDNNIHIDSNGDIYIVGTLKSNDEDLDKCGIVKMSGDGKPGWKKSINNIGQFHDNSITVDVNRNVIVAGTQKSVKQGHGIIKLDSIGNVIWQRAYGDGNTSNNGVATDLNGNIYLLGIKPTESDINGGYNLNVVKINSNGIILWQRILGAVVAGNNNSITVDSGGNVYISGSQNADPVSGKVGFVVVKLNSRGRLAWRCKLATSNSFGQAGVCKLVVDNESNVYFAGAFQKGASSFGVIKFSAQGKVIWKKVLSSYINPSSLCIDGSDNIYFNGKQSFTVGSNNDFYVTKMTSDGDVLWTKLIGGSKHDEGNAITVDTSGCVFINNKNVTYKQRKLQNGCDISIIKLHKEQSSDYQIKPAYDSKFRTYNVIINVDDSDLTKVNMALPVSDMDTIINDV